MTAGNAVFLKTGVLGLVEGGRSRWAFEGWWKVGELGGSLWSVERWENCVGVGGWVEGFSRVIPPLALVATPS